MDKKVILITGASSGIGKATARLLARQGHIVYGAARRISHMDDLKKLGVSTMKLDVISDEECKACIAQVINERERIDVLINNAGFGLYGAVEDISIDDAWHQIDVNLMGYARMTRLTLPYMRKYRIGRIINISSIGGRMHMPMCAWYHASKFAVEGFSDGLRLEVKRFGIDVVIVEPGLINTSIYDIGRDLLMKNSGNGPYRELARAMAETLMRIRTERGILAGSPLDVIAKTVYMAVNARRPRTRYVFGKMSRVSLVARRVLDDRIFDGLITLCMANTYQ